MDNTAYLHVYMCMKVAVFLQHGLNFYLAFLIGSISDINEKISQLDRKLQNYTELVIESRASDHPDEFAHLESVTERGKEIYLKRGEYFFPSQLKCHLCHLSIFLF